MINKIKPGYIKIASLTTFFLVIFYICLSPLRDPDIWFHIKMGELFAHNGLVFNEVFSFSAQGREFMPYEWLFQVGVYFLQETFGFDSIKYAAALVETIQISFLFLILRRIFKLSLIPSFAISLFYLTFTLEFVTARPHVIAYTLFMATLYLILEYCNSAKIRWLIPIIPIMLLWSNTHGSMFLGTALLGSYAGVCLLSYLFRGRKKDWFKKFTILTIFSGVSAALTVMPPLGFGQYQLLWKFFQHRELLSRFIEEWAPLSINGFGFVFYSVIAITVYTILIGYFIFTKKIKENFWLIPLLPFPILAFTASRNLVLGMISLSIITGWLLIRVKWNLTGIKKYLALSLFAAFILWIGWVIYQKKIPQRMYYPVNAVSFIQNYDLQGNMFNEYGYGGYMLYRLYPQKQVFYDGRTEMYLCCEMPDTLELALKKHETDEQFKPTMDWLWNKYNISYVIMRSQKHSVLRKMGRILTDDPNWSLAYWDDDSMIYLRKDGKNEKVINELGTTAATPYNQNPFREGQEDKAYAEYQRMLKVTDSSKSRNAIGFILLKKGQFTEATLEFQKAVRLDASNESPLMNLAELAAKDKNYAEAIEYYERAMTLAQDRGLIYIRLGQLYLQNESDLPKAKAIWQQGVENTVDEETKSKLQQLLSM